MALLTISKAISAGIQRNVAVSTIKHEAKIKDLKLTIAREELLRLDNHSKLLNEARTAHVQYLSTLTPAGLELYNRCKADLEAAIAPPSTED